MSFSKDNPLDALRARRARKQALETGAGTEEGNGAGRAKANFDTDFRTLPGFADMERHRRIGEMLGIKSPFFRLQQGKGGPDAIMDGRPVLNFSNYDYLGLNGHAATGKAVSAAFGENGASAGASRLVAGERPVHGMLEAALAGVYEAEACLAFVSGFGTNLTVIDALTGAKDLILTDSLIHNSVLQGARLSGATRRSFPHNDMSALAAILEASRHRFERVLIVAEGLYSMDGDMPDLAALVALKKRYGCWLMVDEAHALGVLGPTGRGSFEEQGAAPNDVDIWMGTLSKTLASCGGYIAGRAELIDYLKHMAPGFVYSAGLSPVLAAAAHASLRLMQAEPERVAQLRRNGQIFLAAAEEAGLDTGNAGGYGVIPVLAGDSVRAIRASEALLAAGYNVLPILPPAVEDNAARLRFFLSSAHEEDGIRAAVRETARILDGLS